MNHKNTFNRPTAPRTAITATSTTEYEMIFGNLDPRVKEKEWETPGGERKVLQGER